jgi:hypothetical protein
VVAASRAADNRRRDVCLLRSTNDDACLSLELSDEPLTADQLEPSSDPAPRVALFDRLPLAGHIALADRIVIDDPTGVAEHYTSVSQLQHGTAMASLICHGDLNAPGPALSRRIYVRPIMQPHHVVSQQEVILRDQLLVDLIHGSFLRMFEHRGTADAQAPSVRTVNLSIGEPVRMMCGV